MPESESPSISQEDIDIIHFNQGRPQDLVGGGAKNFFFQIWELACREATCCALLGGFGGMLPREFFFETVQFGAFQGVF